MSLGDVRRESISSFPVVNLGYHFLYANPHNVDLRGEAEKRDVETLVGEGQTWAI